MTAKEAYEKYAHLDEALSDFKLLAGSFRDSILYDLWSAIKWENINDLAKECCGLKEDSPG